MVTTDEGGILQALEREERMVMRQTLLKSLWKLKGLKEELDKPAKVGPSVPPGAVHSGQRRVAQTSIDVNLDIGAAD